MTTTIFLIVATGALCALYVLIIEARAYWRWRGMRVVTCPETSAPAAVTVDVGHAALTAAIDATELRLKQCSRWPERRDCGQGCLKQIELAPEDCLVRTILARWYAGKSCALCAAPFGTIQAWDHTPALMGADGLAVQCSDIASARLPAVLATHQPVCWNCYVAEEFRRRNPQLVID